MGKSAGVVASEKQRFVIGNAPLTIYGTPTILADRHLVAGARTSSCAGNCAYLIVSKKAAVCDGYLLTDLACHLLAAGRVSLRLASLEIPKTSERVPKTNVF